MNIISGKIQKYQKIVVYGPEGIGKSTFASQFPQPLFIDTEGSTAHLNVDRLERPSSWAMLMQYISDLKKDNLGYQTLVIDTIDWAEHLCVEFICNKNQVSGIEDFGYGKGYMYEKEEFGRLLNRLQDLVDTQMNVVLTAHAMVRKFERPDQTPYDRYELKLNKAGGAKISDMVKEWADMLLFADYKIEVYKVDSKDSNAKKTKVSGGQRVMYTCHHLNWDAKNRHGLKDCLPFEYRQIAHCIPSKIGRDTAPVVDTKPTPVNPAPPKRNPDVVADKQEVVLPPVQQTVPQDTASIPKELADLMVAQHITEVDIRKAVASRGYFPEDMAIADYPEDFVKGCLIAAFPAIVAVIKELHDQENIPF